MAVPTRQSLTFRARSYMAFVLVGNLPITERVQIGHKTVYRARFAGFDKAGAESASKHLKRSTFECIALQN